MMLAHTRVTPSTTSSCPLLLLLLLQIRSQDYMRTKLKQASSKAIYRLVGMDLFSSESKAYHVAKQFALPPTGARRCIASFCCVELAVCGVKEASHV
jgi:hypothetical protein